MASAWGACDLLAETVSDDAEKKTHVAAAAAFTKGCDGGNADSCRELANTHQFDATSDSMLARIRESLFGMPEAPKALALAAYRKESALREKGCAAGSWKDCSEGGELHRAWGRKVDLEAAPADTFCRRGEPLAEAACGNGEVLACYGYGTMQDMGVGGGKRSHTRWVWAYAMSCEAGVAPDCRRAGQ